MFVAVRCYEWEEEYDDEVEKLRTNLDILKLFFKNNPDVKYYCAYTSRLKAGTIECRYIVFPLSYIKGNDNCYFGGLFGEGILPFRPDFKSYVYSPANVREVEVIGDFHILNGILIKYSGNSNRIIIPDGVKQLKNSVFWNCFSLEKVIIPNSVKSLGGDTFYNCENLKELTIPPSVVEMGDNPFANCPKLKLINKSRHFIFEDGVLYDASRTRLIYCAINRESKILEIPEGIISISKHSFYNCKNLHKIVIPSSVRIIENNPFSNIPKLRLENNSPHFIFKNGALYNKTMTTLFYFEHSPENTTLDIPEGVKIIGRHSFYNCQVIEKISIPTTVKIIGYNPFTNCSRLSLVNKSPNFIYEANTLYNNDMSTLIYHSIKDSSDDFVIPDRVKRIGRCAFFGCYRLRSVKFNEGLSVIDRSAFANCTGLKEVFIPKSVKTLGEWAFANCTELEQISIPIHTTIEKHTFLNCPAKIYRRHI